MQYQDVFAWDYIELKEIHPSYFSMGYPLNLMQNLLVNGKGANQTFVNGGLQWNQDVKCRICLSNR